MLAKGLRTHSVYDCGGYRLSYIKIVYKHRNIPVQLKDGCRLLIKTVVFIQHLVKKFCSMVCTICGKLSHFCIARAQSVLCAMMQHMTAVGHCHVCPTLTNTRLVNPPIEHSVGYPLGPVTKKGGFLANRTNHSRRISLTISIGSLLLSALLFPVRCHSLTVQCRAELRFDHQTVADWSQFCRKAMLNFILICSLQLILMMVVGRGGAEFWK